MKTGCFVQLNKDASVRVWLTGGSSHVFLTITVVLRNKPFRHVKLFLLDFEKKHWRYSILFHPMHAGNMHGALNQKKLRCVLMLQFNKRDEWADLSFIKDTRDQFTNYYSHCSHVRPDEWPGSGLDSFVPLRTSACAAGLIGLASQPVSAAKSVSRWRVSFITFKCHIGFCKHKGKRKQFEVLKSLINERGGYDVVLLFDRTTMHNVSWTNGPWRTQNSQLSVICDPWMTCCIVGIERHVEWWNLTDYIFGVILYCSFKNEWPSI